MSGFNGFAALGDTFLDALQVTDANQQPVDPDSAPTFRVFGPNGLLANAGGTTTPAHTGTITGATNANPIVVTSVAHGLQTGQRVTITGVGGNTNANTTAVITRVSADTFSLNSVAGNAGYTSGGAFKVTGFFTASISAIGGNGFEVGEHYDIHYSWTVSAAARTQVHSFNVT